MNKRHIIYEKYGGHCAYCGKLINYAEMQVDHIQPKCNGGGDEITNLNPSCRLCNHYKRHGYIDEYRQRILTLHARLQKIYIYRVALRYGLIHETVWCGKFYYEQFEEEEEKDRR